MHACLILEFCFSQSSNFHILAFSKNSFLWVQEDITLQETYSMSGEMFSPPETGASMYNAPLPSAALAMSLETAGSIVLLSIIRVPFTTLL